MINMINRVHWQGDNKNEWQGRRMSKQLKSVIAISKKEKEEWLQKWKPVVVQERRNGVTAGKRQLQGTAQAGKERLRLWASSPHRQNKELGNYNLQPRKYIQDGFTAPTGSPADQGRDAARLMG